MQDLYSLIKNATNVKVQRGTSNGTSVGTLVTINPVNKSKTWVHGSSNTATSFSVILTSETTITVKGAPQQTPIDWEVIEYGGND